MSKILETLEKAQSLARGKRVPEKSEPASTTSKGPHSHEMTQRELADIYFSGSGKTKQLPSPTIVRVQDGQKSFYWPWIVTLVALCITVVALFATKRVNVSIQVMDEGMVASASSRDRSAGSQPASEVAAKADPRGTLYLSPLAFDFSHAALPASLKNEKTLILSSNDPNRTVHASLDFNPAFRLSDYVLSFEAKGGRGSESLEVLFRDQHQQTSLNQKPLRPFPLGLTSDWQKSELEVESSDAFDARNVTQMRFALKANRGRGESDRAVLIRNIKWLPKR